MNPFELTKRIGVKEPIPSHTVASLVTGMHPTIPGVDGSGVWFGPGQPPLPQHQEAKGRRFDYRVGHNLQYTPRSGEAVSFEQLRTLADTYDLMRLLIETRKDQLVKFKWNIKPLDDEAEPDKRCQEVEDFLRFPDGKLNWQTWLRALVEDMLVIDAATIYPGMTYGGDVLSLDLMDGAMIQVCIDEQGRRPDPPSVAFQQIIKGVVCADYSADELIYAPRNVRTNRLYGYSPVEQIIMTVNIALRRQMSQLQEYTEGNVPEALASVPANWNVDQIEKWQEYWDALLAGDSGARRRMRFIPDGMKYYPTKEAMLKDPFEEWLARVCCYAFSLPASPFIREMNRATAGTAKESATQEGLHPLLTWVKDTLDLIIWKYFGYTDLQFGWDWEQPVDAKTADDIADKRIRRGSLSVDEDRASRGLDPIGMGPAIFTGGGATLIKDILNPPEPPEGMALVGGKPVVIPVPGEDGDEKKPPFGAKAKGDDKKPAPFGKDKAKEPAPA